MKPILAIVLLLHLVPLCAAETSGRVVWLRVAHLGMPVSGVIEGVRVEPGQRVSQGDELVVLDQRPFQYRVRRTQAMLESSEPALAEARRELERAEELYDRAVSSDHELNEARIQAAAADAVYQVARSDRNHAGWELERSVLRAPFHGQVLAVHATEGESIVSNQQIRQLVTLADVGSLAVVARVPASRAGRLMSVDKLSVRLDGTTLTGRVASLVPISGEDEADYRLVIELPQIDLQGRLGYPAQVETADD